MRIILLCCLCLCAFTLVLAQEDEGTNAKEMYFRYDIHPSDFFSYQITLNTTAKRFYPHADIPNVYHRELTYFFTERIDKIGNDGIVSVEANVDSIRIYVKKGAEEVRFNSQDETMTETMDLRNPELLGTTMILNKPFTYRMTLDGDFIDYNGWENWTTLIDTTSALDSATKFADKEYMSNDFIRTLVLTSAGFTYNRRYFDLEHWNNNFPALVFKTPVIDSAACNIEIPTSHKEIVAYCDGKLYSSAKSLVIREHGFEHPATVDSLTGTMRDTLAMAKRGYVTFRTRTSDMTMNVHEDKVNYTENVSEITEVKLLAYERR